MTLIPFSRFQQCREDRLGRAADLARQDAQRTIEAQAVPAAAADLGAAELAGPQRPDPAVSEHERGVD